MNPPVEVTVVAAIVRRDGRLLLTQRGEDVHLAGKWEFPGGKVEPDESLEVALRREMVEELGIAVEVGPLYSEITHQYPERKVHLHFFECRITEGEPEARCAVALRWLTPGELYDLNLPEANRQLVEQLQAEK